MNFAAIPVELRGTRQWVVWRAEKRDEKLTKVPYRADGGGRASSTDPTTWATFDSAIAGASALDADGIGFVFSESDPFVGVDLDELNADTAAVMAALDSYTERSISGTGFHVIVKASLNGHTRNRTGPIEIYAAGRYFVCTGDHVEGTPGTIEERQGQLNQVLARFLPAPAPAASRQPPSPVDLDDRDLLERAHAARNGEDFRRLWNGDTVAYGDDHSAADLALVNMLRFWTGAEPARMDTLFRASGLYRPKWDSRRGDSTYGAQTIARSLESGGETYSPVHMSIVQTSTSGQGPPGPSPNSGLGSETPANRGRYTGGSLEDARSTFRGWLHLPDTGALDIVLGTVAANRLEGDPVWTLLVGPPGGGKSELLTAVSGLEDAHPAGTLTEAALLSGTPTRERSKAAKGGLLRTIGDSGIIVCKDFGSVLSMNRDARAGVLAALREVYDGAWTRHVGTDGGRTLSWAGKVGLVGGCTPTIDRHHAVMGAMGERFTLYRLTGVDSDLQAREALRHAGREKQMRAELAAAARGVLVELSEPRQRTDEETEKLIALATFVVRARSAVERDGYTRDIELVPGAEAPTRLVIVLDRLLAGLDAIGCERDQALTVITKAALDSIPALRLAALYVLYDAADTRQDTNAVAEAIRHPATTTRRALEDLTAHGLVECERQGEGKAHLWRCSGFSIERMRGFPEKSSNTRSERYRGSQSVSPQSDVSGKP